jgi:hypothetical protein
MPNSSALTAARHAASPLPSSRCGRNLTSCSTRALSGSAAAWIAASRSCSGAMRPAWARVTASFSGRSASARANRGYRSRSPVSPAAASRSTNASAVNACIPPSPGKAQQRRSSQDSTSAVSTPSCRARASMASAASAWRAAIAVRRSANSTVVSANCVAGSTRRPASVSAARTAANARGRPMRAGSKSAAALVKSASARNEASASPPSRCPIHVASQRTSTSGRPPRLTQSKTSAVI